MIMKAQLTNLWDMVKEVLSGRIITLNAYNSKEESLKINNINFQLRK